MRIGIFDSGLGGLTVLNALARLIPQASYIYPGDTARTPYGSRSSETIQRYSIECAEFLKKHDIDVLVVACNTSSAVALEAIKAHIQCPVIGTIEPAVAACKQKISSGTVAVLGTRATITSHVYSTALKIAIPQLEVIEQACPLFVPLVEEGIINGPIVQEVLDLYLSTLRTRNISGIILACTHYPLLSESIKKYFNHDLALIECSQAIAELVTQRFSELLNKKCEPQQTKYFVTDEPSRFNALASSFLEGSRVEAVRLESL